MKRIFSIRDQSGIRRQNWSFPLDDFARERMKALDFTPNMMTVLMDSYLASALGLEHEFGQPGQSEAVINGVNMEVEWISTDGRSIDIVRLSGAYDEQALLLALRQLQGHRMFESYHSTRQLDVYLALKD